MLFLQVGVFPILMCSMYVIFDTKIDRVLEIRKRKRNEEEEKGVTDVFFFTFFLFTHHLKRNSCTL